MNRDDGSEDGGGKKPAGNRKSRDGKGRFALGNRANPQGRPRGSRNRTTVLVEQLLANDAETLTRTLIRRAKAGHGTALNLVFSRLAPVPRDRPVELDLAPVGNAKSIIAAHTRLLQLLGAGELTPSEATAVAQLLELQRRAVEAADLETRLAALEIRCGIEEKN